MDTTKMTVRVPRALLEQARQYAHENNTTLTRLIQAYLGQIATAREPLIDAPIVRRLSGTLSQDVSEDHYRRYLEEKYGRAD